MGALDRCFDVKDFREAARRRLPRGVFEFMDRGAERELALAENIAAFERLKLKSRFMVDLSDRDMGTELFGKRIPVPLAIAPTGIAGLCWHQGELALARAAAAAGVPFTLASASITSMETIAREASGRRWFQFYIWQEEELAFQMVERARDLGFEVLFVTIDTALGRTREYNDRNGFTDPISLNARFIADMMLHPRWVAGVMGRYLLTTGMPRHENYPPQYQQRITRGSAVAPANSVRLSWDHVRRLRRIWPGPLVVKSILNADDARQAVDCGADGVVVSNHGGRALDSAPATIDVLPEVVAAVGDRTTVLLDSGVRHGSDIVKALALGAKAVLIGRATLYGIAAAGQAGAAKVLGLLATQFEKNMGYVGCRRVSELGPHVLFRRQN
ncbi:MAG: alpha-hydroxy-acid oxidizing protein [Alphaproteobacteria bacterium]|nr:alpha-hydroxy-acid oxidizing protein [Alphaproteobacteria bacterium]